MASIEERSFGTKIFRVEDGKLVTLYGKEPVLNRERWLLEWRIYSSRDKEEIIRTIEILLGGDDEEHDFLCQRTALMVDEMLENALYAAPRDKNGRQIFSKGRERTLLPGERITLRCSFNCEELLLEVSDSWGNLSAEQVADYISLNLADPLTEDDRAGRGLFIMWNFLEDFYVNVKPGVETSMGGSLRLCPHI